MRKPVWYRKVLSKPELVDACGIQEIFSVVGTLVHQDDLPYVKEMLEITDACMQQLFVPVRCVPFEEDEEELSLKC